MKTIGFISILMTLTLSSFAPKPALRSSSAQESKSQKQFVPSFIVPEVTADYYAESIEKLKSRVPDGISSIDLVKFRYSYLAYMDKTGTSVPLKLEQDFNKAVQDGDFQKVGSLADKILQMDFTDIRVQMMKAYSQKKNGQDFTFHKTMMNRLEASILDSGNGRTPETAFHVAQVKEEYAVLNSFELQMKKQSLTHIGNHAFDVMECQDKSGKDMTIYFDITEIMKRLSREFK